MKPRRRGTSKLAAAALTLALAACCSSVFAAQAPESDEAAKQQLEMINTAIRAIEQWLQQTRTQRLSEEAALAQLDQQLTDINTGIEQNQARQQQLQTDVQQLDAQITPLLADSKAQRSEIASALAASYLAGSDSQLKLLLNQQDPAIAQRMLVYFQAFNAERLQQINQWLVTISALRQAQANIDDTSQQLQSTTAELLEQENTLRSRQSERQALINGLTAEMASRGGELSRLQDDRDSLQALIEQINRVIADIPELEDLTPFTDSKGGMPWPVAGNLLAQYGQTYGNGQLRRQGIIIGTDAGSPVRAIHPGRVVFSDWLRGSGNLLVVDHGNAYISLYAHTQQLIKHSGDWVNRGEPVAISGNDGGSGEPGIYFEIRRNSQTVNPVEWLEQQN